MPHPQPASRRRALRLVAAAVLCALAALLLPASPAAAHASLLSTDPAEGSVLEQTPDDATFTFTEAVSLPPDGIQVFDAEGDPVEATATSQGAEVEVDLPDELADGTYVVAWRVVSADGHAIAGALSFSVGEPSLDVATPDVGGVDDPAITVAQSVTGGLTYLGSALATGITVFLALVLAASARADRARGRLRRLATVATGVAAISGLLAVPVSVLDQQARPLSDVLDPSAWTGAAGSAWLSVALLLLGLAALQVCRQGRTATRGQALLAAGVGLTSVAPAVVGHTRAFGPEPLVVAADVLHVLAGSVWLGGLVGLALTLPELAGRVEHAAAAVTRFSTIAAGVLVALVATGAFLTWRIDRSWAALVETAHGVLLLAKVAVVAVAVAVAAVNRFVLVPRVRRDAAFDARRAAGRRIGRTVAVEATALVVVLALTGVLVTRPPGDAAATAAPAGSTGVVVAPLGEELKVLAVVEPLRVGRNTVRVQIQDLTGEPIEPSATPRISLSAEGIDLGDVPATSDAAGTLSAVVLLPRGGVWTLQVSLRLSRFENPVAVLDLVVPAA